MDPSPTIMAEIEPMTVRYIKLGQGGRWARLCFETGEMHFGAPHEPHDLCLQGDWDGARQVLIEQLGYTPSVATDAIREMRDFYTQGEDCLWITFADGHLWWAFTASEAIDLRGTPGEHGAVMRRVRNWFSTSLYGDPLRIDTLSTRLTQVAAYQKTICQVKEIAYLLRKINGRDEPMVAQARSALEQTVAAAAGLIGQLHWSDFELFVELLFQRSGWQRVSRLGGNLKDADLILEQPATGERALVQVKSKADQPTLMRYEAIFRSGGYQRLFFVCHSPEGRLVPEGLGGVHIWSGEDLARRAVEAGLMGWLMERTG